MRSESNNIKGHKKRVTESYSSILKQSISPANNIYDESILEKSITCIEHIFKATYILRFNDDIDFDTTNKVAQVNILNKIRKLEDSGKDMSLNKALGSLLTNKQFMSNEYYSIYCLINPERNKATHKKDTVSQESIVLGLTKIKTICNWFFTQFGEYDWEEKYIDEKLRSYETSFMERLSKFLSANQSFANTTNNNSENTHKEQNITPNNQVKNSTPVPIKKNKYFLPIGLVLISAVLILGYLLFFSRKDNNIIDSKNKNVMPQHSLDSNPITQNSGSSTIEKVKKNPLIETDKKIDKKTSETIDDTTQNSTLKYILNDEFKNKEGSNEMAVLIINNNNRTDGAIGQKVATVFLKNKGYNNTTSLLSKQFVTDGLFERLFNGEKIDFSKYKFSEYADYFCLGKLNIKTEQSDFGNTTMTKATINLEIKVVKTTNGGIVDHLTIPSPHNTGAGFTKQEAVEVATENIVNYLKKYKYEN